MTREELIAGGLMKIQEAADFLRVSRTTLYELMDAGKLEHVKIGRSRRVPVVAVHRLAAAHLKGGANDTAQ